MSLASFSWSRNETLWTRWCRHADADPEREAIAFVRAGEPTERWRWGELVQRARLYAGWLQAAGVATGDTCAIISRHHKEFFPVYMAISALVAIPAVLAYPNARLHPDKFRAGLVGMARHSGLNWILCESELTPTIAPLTQAAGSTVRGLLAPYEARLDHELTHAPQVSADAPGLLQHSSGTTGLQKAVVLSHRAILEHVSRYGRAIAANEQDRIVSWLPLYHDMGLIAAFQLPLALGIPTVQLDPFEWITAPILLPEALSAERGTLSWLPNFAYALMGARLREDELEGLSLAHLRMLINCSEPVRAEAHDALLQRLAPLGLRSTALAASYAMAEATFAVTQTPPGQRSKELTVSRDALTQGKVVIDPGSAPTRICVSSGVAIDGCEVRVVDAAGDALPEREVGELAIRSLSMFDGYRNRQDLTAEVVRDGWYYTGDYGFRHGDEWFVVGRKKDLIIVAGKNLYPEDIENEIATVDGAIPGRVVAFGRYDAETGTEHVCAVAETSVPEPAQQALRERIVAAVQRIDVTLSELHLVPPRWLIKSSSGKPSRSANRDRLLASAADKD